MSIILSFIGGFANLKWIRLTAGLVVIVEAIRTDNFVLSIIGITLVFKASKKTTCDLTAGNCAKPLN